MNAAMKYYKSKGYFVENVSTIKSYDLECKRNSKKYFVEVKGSILPIDRIILTHNEVEFVIKNKRQMKLFILHSIKLSINKKKFSASGGNKMILDKWEIDKKKLIPIQYFYKIN